METQLTSVYKNMCDRMIEDSVVFASYKNM